MGDSLPRLSTYRCSPKVSFSWDGKTIRYFQHKKPESTLRWRMLAPLVWEWLWFWSWTWLRISLHLPRIAWNILRKTLFKRENWSLRKSREG
jgi:hypothetical protein